MCDSGIKRPKEEEFWCCICQDVLVDPVTLPCGHSFDNACIRRHSESSTQTPLCPMCRAPLPNPLPQTNVLLKAALDVFYPERIGQKVFQETLLQVSAYMANENIQNLYRNLRHTEVFPTLRRTTCVEIAQEIDKRIAELRDQKRMLESGSDEDFYQISCNYYTTEGMSVSMPDILVLKTLHGMYPNLFTTETNLFVDVVFGAAKRFDKSLIECLIKLGVDIWGVRDPESGMKILHAAVQCNDSPRCLPFVRYLLENVRMDVNDVDFAKRTPMMYQMRMLTNVLFTKTRVNRTELNLCLEMIDELMNKGADINCQDDQGKTALHMAVVHAGNENVVKRLLDRGANKYVQDIFGKEPVRYTRSSKIREILLGIM